MESIGMRTGWGDGSRGEVRSYAGDGVAATRRTRAWCNPVFKSGSREVPSEAGGGDACELGPVESPCPSGYLPDAASPPEEVQPTDSFLNLATDNPCYDGVDDLDDSTLEALMWRLEIVERNIASQWNQEQELRAEELGALPSPPAWMAGAAPDGESAGDLTGPLTDGRGSAAADVPVAIAPSLSCRNSLDHGGREPALEDQGTSLRDTDAEDETVSHVEDATEVGGSLGEEGEVPSEEEGSGDTDGGERGWEHRTRVLQRELTQTRRREARLRGELQEAQQLLELMEQAREEMKAQALAAVAIAQSEGTSYLERHAASLRILEGDFSSVPPTLPAAMEAGESASVREGARLTPTSRSPTSQAAAWFVDPQDLHMHAPNTLSTAPTPGNESAMRVLGAIHGLAPQLHPEIASAIATAADYLQALELLLQESVVPRLVGEAVSDSLQCSDCRKGATGASLVAVQPVEVLQRGVAVPAVPAVTERGTDAQAGPEVVERGTDARAPGADPLNNQLAAEQERCAVLLVEVEKLEQQNAELKARLAAVSPDGGTGPISVQDPADRAPSTPQKPDSSEFSGPHTPDAPPSPSQPTSHDSTAADRQLGGAAAAVIPTLTPTLSPAVSVHPGAPAGQVVPSSSDPQPEKSLEANDGSGQNEGPRRGAKAARAFTQWLVGREAAPLGDGILADQSVPPADAKIPAQKEGAPVRGRQAGPVDLGTRLRAMSEARGESRKAATRERRAGRWLVGGRSQFGQPGGKEGLWRGRGASASPSRAMLRNFGYEGLQELVDGTPRTPEHDALPRHTRRSSESTARRISSGALEPPTPEIQHERASRLSTQAVRPVEAAAGSAARTSAGPVAEGGGLGRLAWGRDEEAASPGGVRRQPFVGIFVNASRDDAAAANAELAEGMVRATSEPRSGFLSKLGASLAHVRRAARDARGGPRSPRAARSLSRPGSNNSRGSAGSGGSKGSWGSRPSFRGTGSERAAWGDEAAVEGPGSPSSDSNAAFVHSLNSWQQMGSALKPTGFHHGGGPVARLQEATRRLQPKGEAAANWAAADASPTFAPSGLGPVTQASLDLSPVSDVCDAYPMPSAIPEMEVHDGPVRGSSQGRQVPRTKEERSRQVLADAMAAVRAANQSPTSSATSPRMYTRSPLRNMDSAAATPASPNWGSFGPVEDAAPEGPQALGSGAIGARPYRSGSAPQGLQQSLLDGEATLAAAEAALLRSHSEMEDYVPRGHAADDMGVLPVSSAAGSPHAARSAPGSPQDQAARESRWNVQRGGPDEFAVRPNSDDAAARPRAGAFRRRLAQLHQAQRFKLFNRTKNVRQ